MLFKLEGFLFFSEQGGSWLGQNKECVFIVMKDHVGQNNSEAQKCVFNSFKTTMELCGSQEEDLSALVSSQDLLTI